MFFDIFYDLCKKKGISCKKAAEDIGLSNSITTKWKKTGATPGGIPCSGLPNTLVSALTTFSGKKRKSTPATGGEREDVLDDVDIAFYGEYKELTEEDRATIRDMVSVMRKRRASGK